VPLLAARALERPLWSRPLAWGTFWLMVAGLLLATIPLLGNAASVMFTFYPPLKAHWAFYVGLTLVVVGTWLVTLNLALTLRGWRVQNPGPRTPLPAFMAMVTFAMWTIASLGIAAEMLFLLIPWSLGLVNGTDALLARALVLFALVLAWPLPELTREAHALAAVFVYGSGLVPLREMVPAGLWLDIAGAILIWVGLRTLCPIVGLT
jgi:cytochrome c oxidase subunit 1